MDHIKKVQECLEFNNKKELISYFSSSTESLDIYFKTGDTPLYVVVDRLDLKLTELFLKHGADPNLTHKNENESPLYNLVCRKLSKSNKKALEILKLLLKYKADSNLKPKNSALSALHYAVMDKNEKAVEILLNYNANVNEHNNPLNATPICFPSSIEVVKLLVENNANLNISQKTNMSPLSQYLTSRNSSKSNIEMINYILTKLKYIDRNIITSINYLIENREIKLLDLLMQKKEIIENEYLIVKSLQHALTWNEKNSISIILKNGANANIISADNSYSPFLESIKKNHLSIVNLFISHGAKIINLSDTLQNDLNTINLKPKMKKLLEIE